MFCEFFGDIIIRKEDVKLSEVVVPGDHLSLEFDEPAYVVVVRVGKTLGEKGE